MKIFKRKLSRLSSAMIDEITRFLSTNLCTVFHEVDFNRVVSDVFHTDFSYNLAYDDDGRLIALCPLHSIKDGSLTNTYSNPAIYDVPYGGWIFDKDKVSLRDLFGELNLSLCESLTYWSFPQIENDSYTDITNKIRYETGVIDLSSSLDDILYKCVSRKRRETITSAVRKGVIVEKLDSSNLDLFIEQCHHLKTSVGLHSLPSGYFVRLFEVYHDKAQLVAFVSKVNGTDLASGVIIANTKIAHLWVAGKPKEVLVNVPRQDLLVWEAIKWAKENNNRYFDLCVVEQERLPNIARFKLGFTKLVVPFYRVIYRGLGYRVLCRARGML